jgi:hypothetical protein
MNQIFLQQRERHTRRLYTVLLMAALIAFLTCQTQWPLLRSGLLMLLAGQSGSALALIWRRSQSVPSPDAAEWLRAELRFMDNLARFDTTFQASGFALLGWALWTSTHNLWLALGLGLVYPLTVYFGMTRPRTIAAAAQLQREMEKLLEEGVSPGMGRAGG